MSAHNIIAHNGTFNCERWFPNRPLARSTLNKQHFFPLFVCSTALSTTVSPVFGEFSTIGRRMKRVIADRVSGRWWMQSDNWLGIARGGGSGFELDLYNTQYLRPPCVQWIAVDRSKLQQVTCRRRRRRRGGNGGDGGGGFEGNWGDSPGGEDHQGQGSHQAHNTN